MKKAELNQPNALYVLKAVMPLLPRILLPRADTKSQMS